MQKRHSSGRLQPRSKGYEFSNSLILDIKMAFPFALRSLLCTFAAIILECLLSDGRNTKRHSTGTGNATDIDRY